jgi:hypothetical protein
MVVLTSNWVHGSGFGEGKGWVGLCNNALVVSRK